MYVIKLSLSRTYPQIIIFLEYFTKSNIFPWDFLHANLVDRSVLSESQAYMCAYIYIRVQTCVHVVDFCIWRSNWKTDQSLCWSVSASLSATIIHRRPNSHFKSTVERRCLCEYFISSIRLWFAVILKNCVFNSHSAGYCHLSRVVVVISLWKTVEDLKMNEIDLLKARAIVANSRESSPGGSPTPLRKTPMIQLQDKLKTFRLVIV